MPAKAKCDGCGGGLPKKVYCQECQYLVVDLLTAALKHIGVLGQNIEELRYMAEGGPPGTMDNMTSRWLELARAMQENTNGELQQSHTAGPADS